MSYFVNNYNMDHPHQDHMSHIGYMIFDTQLDRQMNLRDVRREGRIDSETEFERH